MSDTVQVGVRHGWTVYDPQSQTQRDGGDVVDTDAVTAASSVATGWCEKIDAPPARKRRE